ncbi:MAG TPA: hypothetical protein VFU73_09975 [Actinocrinis sp.]|nr:hypothetical protein [Actinocrinis sp.]
MTDSSAASFVVNTSLLRAGAVLAGAGLALATVGAGIAGFAISRAAREWMQQREVSPTAIAAEKARQVRHATTAGAEAWRRYPQVAASGAGR